MPGTLSRFAILFRNWAAIYINFISQLIPLSIAWTATWTTLKTLDSTTKKDVQATQGNADDTDEEMRRQMEMMKKNVGQVLTLGQQLHRLNSSAPVALAFIISNAVDSLSSLCLCGLFSQYTFFLYTAAVFGFQAYLAVLGRANCQRLAELARQLVSADQARQNDLKTKVPVINGRKPFHARKSAAAEANCVFFTRHLLPGLPLVYGPLCQVNIYAFCTLNGSFMLALLLFVLHYTVLIVQTNVTVKKAS